MGIGNSVSKELVNGMAQAGNGYAEYAGGNERLQPKIIRQVNIFETLTLLTRVNKLYLRTKEDLEVSVRSNVIPLWGWYFDTLTL